MLSFFRKHETDAQIKDRLLNICEDGDYGIFPPPMKADIAFDELRNFFLGKNWYSNFSEGNKPSVSEIVRKIENKYKFKKSNSSVFNTQMDSTAAIEELKNFFLGKDWYTANPVGHEQVITEIVYEIETKYKRLAA